MSSEKARKLNTREIFVYTLVRTWYIRPALCGHWMDDFMYRGSGGGGVLEITILVTRGSTYPF